MRFMVCNHTSRLGRAVSAYLPDVDLGLPRSDLVETMCSEDSYADRFMSDLIGC